jgi:glycine C-acetyltransferase
MKTFLLDELSQIKDAGLFKDERIITSPQNAKIAVLGGEEVLNFCANNYLGLSSHPEIINAARESYEKW